MKKTLTILALSLTVLFSSPVINAEPPPFDISKIIPNYEKGQIIAYFDEEDNLVDKSQAHYYRKYLGTTPEGYFLIQDFYYGSNKKRFRVY